MGSFNMKLVLLQIHYNNGEGSYTYDKRERKNQI
jgi:hypothetical protein